MATERGNVMKELFRLLKKADKLYDGQVEFVLDDGEQMTPNEGERKDEDAQATPKEGEESQETEEAQDEGTSEDMNIFFFITPNDGPYRKARIKFHMRVDVSQYPDSPPEIHCRNNIYHPNINVMEEYGSQHEAQADICVNLLDSDWQPEVGLDGAVMAVLFLFYNAQLDDALSPACSDSFDNEEYEANVRRSLRGEDIDGYSFDKLLIDNDDEEEAVMAAEPAISKTSAAATTTTTTTATTKTTGASADVIITPPEEPTASAVTTTTTTTESPTETTTAAAAAAATTTTTATTDIINTTTAATTSPDTAVAAACVTATTATATPSIRETTKTMITEPAATANDTLTTTTTTTTTEETTTQLPAPHVATDNIDSPLTTTPIELNQWTEFASDLTPAHQTTPKCSLFKAWYSKLRNIVSVNFSFSRKRS